MSHLESLSIGFTGDVCLTEPYVAEDTAFSEFIADEIVHFFLQNDFNVIDLEGPILNSQQGVPAHGTLFSTPTLLEVLQELNCTVLNLANNHIMDLGPAGLEQTIALAGGSEFKHFGAGRDIDEASRPLFVRKGDISVGLLGICHDEGQIAGWNSPGPLSEKHREIVRDKIRDLKKKVDWVIVNYHGGEEYTFIPSPQKRSLLLSFLNDGADVVVGHHPHVIQPYEALDNKCVFYSLGNFLLDLDWFRNKEGTRESILLGLRFSKQSFTFTGLVAELDASARKLTVSSENRRFFPLETETHEVRWCQDSYRLVRSFLCPRSVSFSESRVEGHRSSPPWTKLLAARYVFDILKSPRHRSILAGALMHIIRSTLRMER